jgi:hypothetical protein
MVSPTAEMVTVAFAGGTVEEVLELEELDGCAVVEVVEPCVDALLSLCRPKTATATAAPSRQRARTTAARRRGRLRSGEDEVAGGRWAISRPYANDGARCRSSEGL